MATRYLSKRISIFLLQILILSLFTPVVCSAENLRIGYIGALTGDAAALGTEIMKVLQVSVDEVNQAGGINGRKLELIVEDDGYDVKRTISAYEKLKSNLNSKVLFMTTYGGLFTLGKRAETDDIVIVDTLDCNDDIVRVSSMHTCVATRTESIGEGFLEKIRANGDGKVGVLYEQEAWFNFIVGTLRKALGNNLIEVVAPVQSGDYRAEVLKLKNAKVDHVVFLGNDSMGRAFAQARNIGLKASFYSIASVTSRGFSDLAGDSLNGTFVSNWVMPRNDNYLDFTRKFKARHGSDVALDFVAGPTYDAGKLVINVLQDLYASHSEISGKQIRAALSKEDPFDGVSGRIKMDDDGAVRSIRERLFRYEKGNLVPLQ